MSPFTTYVGPHLSKHILPVVPHAAEAQHLPIQLNKLAQLVVRGRSGIGVLRLAARLHVGVTGVAAGREQLNTLTAHELLQDAS